MILSMSRQFRFTGLIRDSDLFCSYIDPPRTAAAVWAKAANNLPNLMKYISKSETHVYGPVTWGAMPYQGKRNDLHEIVDQFLENKLDLQATASMNPYGYVKHGRGLKDLKDQLAMRKPYPRLEEVIVVVGSPGSGKSHWVQNEWPLDSIYSGIEKKTNQTPYHPGYCNQEVYWIEEMDGSFFKFRQFKDIFDIGRRTQATISNSTAGSSVPFGSRVAVFTSNRLPWEWYKDDIFSPMELFRRITRVLVFGGQYSDKSHWHADLQSADDLDQFYQVNMECKKWGWVSDTAFKALHSKFHSKRVMDPPVDATEFDLTHDTRIAELAIDMDIDPHVAPLSPLADITNLDNHWDCEVLSESPEITAKTKRRRSNDESIHIGKSGRVHTIRKL